MLKVANRVQETTNAAGTGDILFQGAVPGFRSMSSSFQSGDKIPYIITKGILYEVGTGTLTSGSPWSLSRDEVIVSSNNNQKIDVQIAMFIFVDATTSYLDELKDHGYILPLSTGFSITAGVIPKTLTVLESGSISGVNTGDQDLAGLVHSNRTALDTMSGTNTGDQYTFKAIAVSGQSNIISDSPSGTLTLVAGNNISIATNNSDNSITIESLASSAINFIWKGNWDSPPPDAEIGWAYYNTSDRITYFYNISWEVLADAYNNVTWSESGPISNSKGDIWVNTSNGGVYRWNGSSWQTIFYSVPFAWPSLITSAELSYLDGTTSSIQTQLNSIMAVSGSNFVWKGNLTSAPASASSGWVYYNTHDKVTYIYTTEWETLSDQFPDITYGTWNQRPSNPSPGTYFRDTGNGITYRASKSQGQWDVVVQGLPFTWPDAITATEVGYLDGVDSNIQTSLTSISSSASNLQGQIDTIYSIAASGGFGSPDEIPFEWPGTISSTEVGYLDGLTSNIQTQLGDIESLLYFIQYGVYP